jgi:hypothetical protein
VQSQFLPWISGYPETRSGDVKAVTPHVPKLIESLADAFQCKRRKAAALHGATWRVGAVETGQGNVTLFFHPSLRDETDLRALGDALSREVRSGWKLIITAEGALPVDGAATVNLGEVVELDDEEGHLVPLSDPCTLVVYRRKIRVGAQSLRITPDRLDRRAHTEWRRPVRAQ